MSELIHLPGMEPAGQPEPAAEPMATAGPQGPVPVDF